jgi:hypothetical protein
MNRILKFMENNPILTFILGLVLCDTLVQVVALITVHHTISSW